MRQFATSFWILIGVSWSFGVLWIYSWTAYTLLYAFILSLSILFTIILLDQKRPVMGKYKTKIHFLASYSFSLFLIHYSVFSLTINLKNSISVYTIFMASFIAANACAIAIAFYGEMRYKSVAAYIKKTFMKLEGTPK